MTGELGGGWGTHCNLAFLKTSNLYLLWGSCFPEEAASLSPAEGRLLGSRAPKADEKT